MSKKITIVELLADIANDFGDVTVDAAIPHLADLFVEEFANGVELDKHAITRLYDFYTDFLEDYADEANTLIRERTESEYEFYKARREGLANA